MSCRNTFVAVISLGFAAISAGCASRQNHASATAQFASEKMVVPGIKDLGKVDDFLYRGAQPTEAGIEQLKKMGIDTIVDLRNELHGEIANEREHADSFGMRFVNLP